MLRLLPDEPLCPGYAVGGHVDFAIATYRCGCPKYKMTYTYFVEDTFTFWIKGAPWSDWLAQWHTKGLASDFWTTGYMPRDFSWTKGDYTSLKCK